MKNIILLTRTLVLLVLANFVTTGLAQQLSITDPGLDAAIRAALQKPSGQLTEQDLLSLTNLDASNRNISNVDGLDAARNLIMLDLSRNTLTSLSLPASLTNLASLFLVKNQLTNFVLPPDLIHLVQIDLTENLLTKFILPSGLTNLSVLTLRGNQLTNFIFPPDLSKLTSLSLGDNQFTNFTLPAGLTNLEVLDLAGNELTSFTLPPDQTKLTSLSLTAVFFDGTRLATFVLSEPLAATNLAETVAFLQSQGVLVVTYPLAIQLVSPTLFPDGTFNLALIGPPGIYTILGSADLFAWGELGAVTNQLGTARFTDPAPVSPRKFYRARSAP